MKNNKRNKDLVLDDYYEDEEFSFDTESYANYSNVDSYFDTPDYYDQVNYIEEEVYDEEPEDRVETAVKTVKSSKSTKTSKSSSKKSYSGEEYYEDDSDIDAISLMSLISTWFGRIGMFIAVILCLVFLFSGQFKNLILYVISLGVAYLFGYVFMYLLVFFTSLNDK